MVFAFVLAFVGAVLGHLGRRQIARNGRGCLVVTAGAMASSPNEYPKGLPNGEQGNKQTW
jgi:hypothetical protein